MARIQKLHADSPRQWGQMTVYQMIRHNILWEEMLQGKTIYKQSLLGKIVGKFALKDMLKDEPAKRNLPTVPAFRMTSDGDVESAKAEWLAILSAHEGRTPAGFMHPFFGQLTAEQAGTMTYKHADHHLRQFNA